MKHLSTNVLLPNRNLSMTKSNRIISSILSRPHVWDKSRAKQQFSSVRNDCSLFSRLYISCQTHKGDLDKFFAHENQAPPPSPSNIGKLRLRNKSDVVSCLEELVRTSKGDDFADIHQGPSLLMLLHWMAQS